MSDMVSKSSLIEQCALQLKRPSRPPAAIDLMRWRIKPRPEASEFQWPFFWHEPEWHLVDKKTANEFAIQTAASGVAFSALLSEVGCANALTPRIVPYRPDRFGFTYADLDGATAIDLRLAETFTLTAPVRYDATRLRRWAILPEKINPSGCLDAPHWPGDVRSPPMLERKVQQLRALSQQRSAVWMTCDLYAVEELQASLIAARPDALIVQARGRPASSLLSLLPRIRRMLSEALPTCRLGVVADVQTPTDLAWLWTVGAELIALDSLLHGVIQAVKPPVQKEANSFFYGSPAPPPPPTVNVHSILADLLDRTISIVHSLGAAAPPDLYLSEAFVKS